MEYGEIFNELNSSVIKKPYYDTERFEQAVFLLAETKETLAQEESWCLDMQDLLRQVLNNRACRLALEARDAWKAGRKEEQDQKVKDFFRLFDACDRLMSIRKDTTLAHWLEYGAKAGAPYGQETQKLFVQDAKRLITTWAGEKTYETLADYAYRQYGGLLKQYYRPRWERFFKEWNDLSVKEWYQMAEEFILSEDDLAENNLAVDGPAAAESAADAVCEIDKTLRILQEMEW